MGPSKVHQPSPVRRSHNTRVVATDADRATVGSASRTRAGGVRRHLASGTRLVRRFAGRDDEVEAAAAPIRPPEALDGPQAGGALGEELERPPHGEHLIGRAADVERTLLEEPRSAAVPGRTA